MNGWWMKIVTSDRWRQQKIWVRAAELRIVSSVELCSRGI
jgi:hypothetical protein